MFSTRMTRNVGVRSTASTAPPARAPAAARRALELPRAAPASVAAAALALPSTRRGSQMPAVDAAALASPSAAATK